MSDFWAMVLAWSIPGIFGLKLLFWDIPIRNERYWKGVFNGLIGAAGLTALVLAFTHHFMFGVVVVFAGFIIYLASRRPS